MEGTVTKRKDGRWQGTVEIPSATKKRVRKFVYAATRQECKRKLRELIEQYENNSLINPTKTTFKEFARFWLDTYCINLSPTTIDGYTRIVNVYAAPHIGEMKLSKILPMHIQLMMNEFSKNHSRKTCNNLVSVVRSVFNYAKINHIIKENPVSDINIVTDKIRYKYRIYNEEEFNRLLEVVTGTEHEIPVLLAGLCGMRASEIMGLTWNNIDFDTGTIKITSAYVYANKKTVDKTTKTYDSYRDVIAPSYVIDRLRESRKDSVLVFPRPDGSPNNSNRYGKMFSRMLEKNGLPHTRFHDLRHFNATMMMIHGITEKEASERLGHSSVNMTRKYQHVLKDRENRTAEILNKVVRADFKMAVKMAVNGFEKK